MQKRNRLPLLALLLAACFLSAFSVAAFAGEVQEIAPSVHYDATEFIVRVVHPGWIIDEAEGLAYASILNHSFLVMRFPEGFSLSGNIGEWLKVTIEEPLNRKVNQRRIAAPLAAYTPVEILAVEPANVLSVHTVALHEDHMTGKVLYDHDDLKAGETVDIYFTAEQSVSEPIKVYGFDDIAFQEYLCYEVIDGVHYLVHYDGGGWG